MASLTRTYSDEKTSGRVYTPTPIVQRILDSAGYTGPRILGARILDPACGDGQFLVEVVNRLCEVVSGDELRRALENVHGWDTDPNAVESCRARLDDAIAHTGQAVTWNVQVRNSLDALAPRDLFGTSSETFDFVVGNPPYVRIQHLEAVERQRIQNDFSFCASGSTDLYVAFFELGLSLLAPEGVLAFITPNTYFHTSTGRRLRQHLAEGGHLRHIVNFGHRQVFPGATTYAAITIASRTASASFEYVDASGEIECTQRRESAWLSRQGIWRFEQEATFLDPQRFRPLREIARIHVGLATLADSIFVVQDIETGDGVSDVATVETKYHGIVQIERGLLRPVIKGSKVKIGRPCLTGAFIVFPYDLSGPRPRLIDEVSLAARFPNGYEYLCAMRERLDARDNGRPNAAGWYAFGRTQALASAFGEKILCPPMAPAPTFVVCRDADATVYSGYFIKYGGDLDALAAQLNSERMHAFVQAGGRDYLGGWKGYSKAAFQDFPVDTHAL